MKIFKLNLKSHTYASLQLLDKSQWGKFKISPFLDKSRLNKNCNNFRTITDIDMNLDQKPNLIREIQRPQRS